MSYGPANDCTPTCDSALRLLLGAEFGCSTLAKCSLQHATDVCFLSSAPLDLAAPSTALTNQTEYRHRCRHFHSVWAETFATRQTSAPAPPSGDWHGLATSCRRPGQSLAPAVFHVKHVRAVPRTVPGDPNSRSTNALVVHYQLAPLPCLMHQQVRTLPLDSEDSHGPQSCRITTSGRPSNFPVHQRCPDSPV